MMTTNITLLNTSTSQCTEKSQEVLTFYQKATTIDSALVSILKLGGRLIITFFEIFQIKCSYVVNSKKVGGRSPKAVVDKFRHEKMNIKRRSGVISLN